MEYKLAVSGNLKVQKVFPLYDCLTYLKGPDGAYSHRNDDTSVAAAAEYQRSGKLQRDQLAVLALIYAYPTLTASEMAELCNMSQVKICRRRKELEVPNLPFHPLIRRLGKKKTAFEKRGAWVYEITQAGKDYLNQTTKGE